MRLKGQSKLVDDLDDLDDLASDQGEICAWTRQNQLSMLLFIRCGDVR